MSMSQFYSVQVPDFDLPKARLTLTGWLTESGAEVESGDPLCEICAGDILIEIGAKRSGVFRHAEVELDDEISTGMIIGTIELETEAAG